MAGLIACDIETGPLSDGELLRLYDPPEMLGEFDPSAVDTGRATKAETIAKKIAEARAAHKAALADWPGYCERHKAEWLAATKEKAALNPLTGEILTVGWGGDEKVALIYGNGEACDLMAWWLECEEHRECGIVFHNGFGFDLPFLIRRSWLLDVTVPDWVLSIRGSRVYFNQDVFLDTMTTWFMGEYNKYIRLGKLAKIFGIEGKTEGCDGADFARMWYGTPEEHQLALKYAEQDVRVTLRLAQLMGMG